MEDGNQSEQGDMDGQAGLEEGQGGLDESQGAVDDSMDGQGGMPSEGVITSSMDAENEAMPNSMEGDGDGTETADAGDAGEDSGVVGVAEGAEGNQDADGRSRIEGGGSGSGAVSLQGYEWREVRLVPFSFSIGTARLPTIPAYVPVVSDSRPGQRAFLALQPLVDFLGAHGSPSWRNIRRAAGLAGHLLEVGEVPASFQQDGTVRDWLKKKRKESRWELIDLDGVKKIHVQGGMLIPSTLCGPQFSPAERRQVLSLLEKLAEFVIAGKDNLPAALAAMHVGGSMVSGPLSIIQQAAAKMDSGFSASALSGGAHTSFGGFGSGGPSIPPLPMSVSASLPSFPFQLAQSGGSSAAAAPPGGLLGPAPGPGSFAHALFASQQGSMAGGEMHGGEGEVGEKRGRGGDGGVDASDGEGAGALEGVEKRARFELGPRPQEPKPPETARSPYIMFKEYSMEQVRGRAAGGGGYRSAAGGNGGGRGQAKTERRNPAEAGREARSEWDRAGCGSELHRRWEHAAREDAARYARESEVYGEQMREVGAWEMQEYAQRLKQAVDDGQEEPLRLLLEEVQRKLSPGGRLNFGNEMQAFEGADSLQQLHGDLVSAVNAAGAVSRGLTLQAGVHELSALLDKARRCMYGQDLDDLRRALAGCDAFNRKFGAALRQGNPEKAAELDAVMEAAASMQKRLEGEEADRRMSSELKRMAKGKRDDELMAHAKDYRECVESCVALLHEVAKLWDERARQVHRMQQDSAQRHQQSELQLRTVKKAIAKNLREQIVHLPSVKAAPRTVTASSANIDEELFRRLFPGAQGLTYQITNPSHTFNVSGTYFSKNLRSGGYISMDACTATLTKDGTLKVTGIGKRSGPVV